MGGFIKLLSNPRKITPCALNIGIKNAMGEIIMRMDAHATFEKSYISKCVKYLNEYNADNVGGTMITRPRKDTFIGKTIVTALSNRFGVGGSAFRIGAKEVTEVDTVFGGCYRKEVFDKIGFFNEKLSNTQDVEFNLRLKKKNGKILLVPDIVSYYYTRSDFKSFLKNNFRNGIWVILPFKFTTTMPVSLRHLIPLLFVLSLIGLLSLWSLLSLLSLHGLLSLLSLLSLLFIITLYFLASIYFSVKIALRENDLRYFFIMPIIFASLHIGYGLGSMWGLVKLMLPERNKD
ncbi:MAG: glycosyltransferase family 2 protein [Actinobacteria bacterium]|nr:glycosyltransferase family 2 protein [Actinomycetota bacterium]